jgi:hypothetical protein
MNCEQEGKTMSDVKYNDDYDNIICTAVLGLQLAKFPSPAEFLALYDREVGRLGATRRALISFAAKLLEGAEPRLERPNRETLRRCENIADILGVSMEPAEDGGVVFRKDPRKKSVLEGVI